MSQVQYIGQAAPLCLSTTEWDLLALTNQKQGEESKHLNNSYVQVCKCNHRSLHAHTPFCCNPAWFWSMVSLLLEKVLVFWFHDLNLVKLTFKNKNMAVQFTLLTKILNLSGRLCRRFFLCQSIFDSCYFCLALRQWGSGRSNTGLHLWVTEECWFWCSCKPYTWNI